MNMILLLIFLFIIIALVITLVIVMVNNNNDVRSVNSSSDPEPSESQDLSTSDKSIPKKLGILREKAGQLKNLFTEFRSIKPESSNTKRLRNLPPAREKPQTSRSLEINTPVVNGKKSTNHVAQAIIGTKELDMHRNNVATYLIFSIVMEDGENLSIFQPTVITTKIIPSESMDPQVFEDGDVISGFHIIKSLEKSVVFKHDKDLDNKLYLRLSMISDKHDQNKEVVIRITDMKVDFYS